MAQSFLKKSGTLAYTNDTGSDQSSGDVVDLGGRIGIVLADISNGSSGTLSVSGQWVMAKDASVIADDAVVYWSVSGSQATTSPASGDPRVGVASAAAATGASYVTVDINVADVAGRTSVTYPATGAGDATSNQIAISAILAVLQAAGIVEND